jgi:hypothetical protein
VFMPRSRWQFVIRSSGAGLLLLVSGLEQTVAAQARSSVTEQWIGTPGASRCQPVVIPASECFRQAAAPPQRVEIFATRAPDHRYEGLAIGAVLGAVGGGLLGAVACGQSDDPGFNCTGAVLGIGLLGAGLGGLTGLLVGAQFPKGQPTAPADSTARRCSCPATS